MVPPYLPAARPRAALPLVAAGAAFVLTLYLLLDRLSPPPLHADSQARAVAPRGDLMDVEKTIIAIYERNRSSVVHITSPEVLVRTEDAWGPGVDRIPEGTGSGFVWDERGFVVTNYHVVAIRSGKEWMLRDRVLVRLLNQIEYEAQVIGGREDLDIAVVRITDPPDGLQPIEVGSSSNLRVGQTVLAIGNPFGLDHTLSVGVISALDRTLESLSATPIPGVIQVDAAINPGNSGGPLLDSSGRLIGMNTAIKSVTGASAGIGFAVPVDRINRIVPQLIKGDPDRPEAAIGLDLHYWQNRVVVVGVRPGSGAERAGLRVPRRTGRTFTADFIVAIDGKPIGHIEDIYDALRAHKPGDRVVVDVLRGLPPAQEQLKLEVELSARAQLR